MSTTRTPWTMKTTDCGGLGPNYWVSSRGRILTPAPLTRQGTCFSCIWMCIYWLMRVERAVYEHALYSCSYMFVYLRYYFRVRARMEREAEEKEKREEKLKEEMKAKAERLAAKQVTLYSFSSLSAPCWLSLPSSSSFLYLLLYSFPPLLLLRQQNVRDWQGPPPLPTPFPWPKKGITARRVYMLASHKKNGSKETSTDKCITVIICIMYVWIRTKWT